MGAFQEVNKMEDNLKELKDRLNKIPDTVLENIGIGNFEDADLSFIWDDEDWTEEYYKTEKKYPELKEIMYFFGCAFKVFNESKGFTDEDARLMFPKTKG